METSSALLASAPAKVGAKPWGLPAILLALALPALLWFASFFVDEPEEFTVGETIALLITTILFKDLLFIGLAAGLALWRYHLRWRALGFSSFDQRLWWMPVVAVMGAWLGLIIYAAALTGAGVEPPKQEELDPFFDNAAVLPLTWFALVVMAPLSEEIFFRGFIFAGLIGRFGVPAAMVVSGLVFATFHVSGLSTVGLLLPIGLIGVLFAWLYYRTGSLWPSIATHSLFNFVSFLAMATAGSG